MGNISKIKVNGSEYNVTQSGAVSDVSLVCDGSEGTKYGSVSINYKGNVAIESLSKHVNIESVKGIQMKPTTNIIIDTTRRRLDPSKGDNKAEVEVVFDDIKDSGTAEDTSYGELTIHARNFDLRCHDHGGIALQPCLCDHPNTETTHFENKIKFESSRRKDINTNVGELYDVSVADYDDEGGEGLEFGTFNNMHTSLYTKDYRFNKDGYVYAVNRGTPLVESGKTKFDYPTQADDTKDVKVNKTRWISDDASIDVSLKASWEEIVWTARQYMDGCIGGGGTGGGDATKEWVNTNFASKNDISAFITGVPNPLQYITESAKNNFQIDIKDMSTYDETKSEYNYANLNLESNGSVKVLSAGTDSDIEELATNNVVIVASKLKLYDVSIDSSGEIVEGSDMATLEAENGLSMGTTPNVGFLTTKISKKAALETITPQLALMMQNNFDESTYYDSSNNIVHVPSDKVTTLYLNTACTSIYKPTATSKKTDVYLPDGTLPTEEYYFVINTDSSIWFYVEINSDHQAKKEPKQLDNVNIESASYIPETTFVEMGPSEIKVVDTVNIADIVELVKHKDALLNLLQQQS